MNRSVSASVAFEHASDPDRDALPRELIDDAEHPESFSIVTAVSDEIIRPHLIGTRWSQTDI
jgi:hypothetical protein